MVLAPRLEMRQGQALVMTPQLQQAIKLLQLSNVELSAYIEEELERNPLLEKSDDDSSPDTPEAREGDGDSSLFGDDDGSSGDVDDGPAESHDMDFAAPPAGDEPLSQLDTDPENIYQDDTASEIAQQAATPGETDSGWSSLQSGAGAPLGEDLDFESNLSEAPTLGEHLLEQLNMTVQDPVERMIGVHLIDMVDDTGYVTGDLAELAERLGAEETLVEATLVKMQAFEPTGVMARSLVECLRLQLVERDRCDPAMQALLDNIDLLARRDYAGLMSVCGVDREDLAEMFQEIKALDPKPGLAFEPMIVQPVIPDVHVREQADGTWLVELNSETLPRVLVNRQYHATVSTSARSSEDKTYISECFANANWLVKSLDQRARTILKVSREIVRQQDAFLAYGVQHLRPLNLRTVADAISMHESTVSRVTSNKYMSTPRGLFELKYFFSSSIASTEGGDAHSAEAVRHRIKELIEGEKADRILSDDKIVEILNEAGIDIARRTVAKYREAMHIPSSIQRRREKRAIA